MKKVKYKDSMECSLLNLLLINDTHKSIKNMNMANILRTRVYLRFDYRIISDITYTDMYRYSVSPKYSTFKFKV
jgi:hypothetical protein